VNSELILCSLNHMDNASSKCFLSQFHRGISCAANDFEAFEDECALGKISSVPINYSLPIELIAGFSLFSDSDESNVFLIRLTTALTDYMAYTSNSDMQHHYVSAREHWLSIRLTSEMKSDLFAINEEEAFARLISAGAAAQRSIPDQLDRGLTTLKNLPNNVKMGIEKQAKKKSLPENMMNRDWVMDQIKRMEQECKPKYSWATTTTPTKQPCLQFMHGNCTFGNKCRFQHAGIQEFTTANPPNASLFTAAPDDVDIDCTLQMSPQCTKTFRTSPAYWAQRKTADGKPYSMPKSCKPCRQLKKQQYSNTHNCSLFTVQDQDINQDIDSDTEEEYAQHSDDGADDDYMTQYCMTMSGI
jgi:hypothetical protein